MESQRRVHPHEFLLASLVVADSVFGGEVF